MPFLSITTNQDIPKETEESLLKEGSKAVAARTGKPEQYVMVTLRGSQPLLFAGQEGPAAFLEVKSIGFPGGGEKALTKSLCDLVTKHLAVPGNRIYVVFEDVKASMWAHNGETFG
jgi:phenylpyruvate tautomerase PptA (4-oxalocrotonate tautomerase family)